MLRGFSSLGAPSLSLSDLRQLALDFSLDFLELRAVNTSADLPYLLARGELTYPSENTLPIRLVASDLRLLDTGPAETTEFLS